jgi:hypothetical protein
LIQPAFYIDLDVIRKRKIKSERILFIWLFFISKSLKGLQKEGRQNVYLKVSMKIVHSKKHNLTEI